jgi:hypothetical protein
MYIPSAKNEGFSRRGRDTFSGKKKYPKMLLYGRKFTVNTEILRDSQIKFLLRTYLAKSRLAQIPPRQRVSNRPRPRPRRRI